MPCIGDDVVVEFIQLHSLLGQVASSIFPSQPNWTVPYLHDAVYLYLLTVDSMISAGVDYRNASHFIQSTQYMKFTGENESRTGIELR
jgi:hypothetical protein